MIHHKPLRIVLQGVMVLAVSLLLGQTQAADIGTEIGYQGRLDDANAPAKGDYDFKFSLFDDLAAGTQIGSTVSQTITVTDGIFNTTLDFGAGAFNDQARFLEIEVQPSGGGGYTTLLPRQPITTVPHAAHAAAPNRDADTCALARYLFDTGGAPPIPTFCDYAIGDTGPAGGIVFYVTDGGLHGLEAAPADSAPSLWGCWGTVISGADGTAIGTGAQNTADIVAGCVSAEVTAAEVANDFSLNGFTDWFLASKDELNELYLQRAVVGGFADNGSYWGSSEINSISAWFQFFYNGNQSVGSKLIATRVRLVRAF